MKNTVPVPREWLETFISVADGNDLDEVFLEAFIEQARSFLKPKKVSKKK